MPGRNNIGYGNGRARGKKNAWKQKILHNIYPWVIWKNQLYSLNFGGKNSLKSAQEEQVALNFAFWHQNNLPVTFGFPETLALGRIQKVKRKWPERLSGRLMPRNLSPEKSLCLLGDGRPRRWGEFLNLHPPFYREKKISILFISIPFWQIPCHGEQLFSFSSSKIF